MSRGGRFARDLALKPQTISCSHWVAMEQSLSPSLSRGGFYTADLCSFVPSTQAEQLRDLQRPELWQGATLIARGSRFLDVFNWRDTATWFKAG